MAQPVELPSKIEVGPVIDEGHSLASVSDKISGIVLKRKITIGWVFGFLIAFALVQVLLGAATWLIVMGAGIWGINIPIGWGFAIVNFVWWIGIGHAGTLISAILLLLLNQSWRTAINRFAGAMTIFAVLCAGMFPVLHTGRPWLAYWLMPYPSTMWLWPQFRSPLVWDVFAVSTYLTFSAVFWYVGLIPDFATLRDSAKHRWKQVIYGMLAMAWRSSARHWQRYEKAGLLLAGLSTLLVVSVHTVVSFDFARSMIPGWHATTFPPYFVAGAIYSGFALVLTLTIPIRKFHGLEDIVTLRLLPKNITRVRPATGLQSPYEPFALPDAWGGLIIGSKLSATIRETEKQRARVIDQQVCNRPRISRLIEQLGYGLLLDTLDLSDEAFSEILPALPMGPAARRQLKRKVTKHYAECSRCQLIAENHLWADAELDNLLRGELIDLRAGNREISP